MERTSILLLLLALVAVRADTGNLWPLPQSSSVGSEYANLNPSTFQFKCIGSSCTDVLKEAFKRYHHYIFFAGDSTSNAAASLSSILVNASSSTKLDLDMDESYTLTVNSTTAVITSNTEWGALRGLETFSQLTDWNYNTDTYFIASLPVSIQDSPRFKWRGLLIDTSRHYLPLSQIYKAIDALAFDKFNVLHWHIVDAQSFPYQSQVFPLLTHGAWIPKAIYTPADVKSVIQYAYNRGVRVVPEIDTPGHSASWGVGYPQLFPKCTQKDVLNPTTDYTMSFVKSFFQEISTVFSDHYMHMGGDEVTYDCWKQDPSIATWMAKNNIADYKGLQAYYETQVEKMVNGYGKIPIFWEEVYDNSPSGTLQFNTTVVNVWFSANTKIAEVVKAGYRATYSTPWYLDKELPDSETFYEWEDTWIAFYNSEPLSGLNLTPQEEALVLGGEASMWGEQVDETSFDVRVWPRASAIAERLWSSKSVVDHNAATPRLGTQRCRMVRRGINASPVYPDYCTTKADKTISIDEIIV